VRYLGAVQLVRVHIGATWRIPLNDDDDDDDSTSGTAERWKPITVAGETTFPVQPSAACYLSFDVDDSPVRSCRSFS